MEIKISLGFIKKNKRDIYFVFVGLILTSLLAYIFINGISYFVASTENALGIGSSSYSPVTFNISGLKSLDVYKGAATDATTTVPAAIPETSTATSSVLPPAIMPAPVQ